MKRAAINKEILRLAIPNTIANIAIPMLGMVDTAIAGRIGEDVNIGALSIGATIFSFIYWNCSFLRMGTSGITAQAYGAGNKKECANMLVRALWLGVAISLLLLLFQQPIGHFALYVMKGSAEVQALASTYLFARIWAAPASISLFAIQGWFIGMQDAKTPMIATILSVIMNAIFSYIFVFYFNMGIVGIAYGTVAAQYSSLLFSAILFFIKYRTYLRYFSFKESFQLKPIVHFMRINQDIFLRSAFVNVVYTFFTAASARFGDTILATNALLMQLFTLFSYMSDGFAYAGESLCGRFVGERNVELLKRFINGLLAWALGVAVLFVLLYLLAWKELLMLFSSSADIMQTAQQYIGWVIATPLLGTIPFMMDGIMIGATKTKLLRNSTFLASVLFFAAFYALTPMLDSAALWIAFLIFLLFRGVFLYLFSNRLDAHKIIGD